MAKTLKDLKAKLGELQGPEDNTVATKNFYKKHKTVEHPDPAGNGDDVFKASNVRTVNRSPNHGYNPGEDAAVFEDVGGYSDVDVKRSEQRKKAVMAAKAKRRVVDDEGFKKDDKPRWDSAKDEVEAGTQASSRKGLATASSERTRRNLDPKYHDRKSDEWEKKASETDNALLRKSFTHNADTHMMISQRLRLQKNSYDPKGNKLDEILGFSKKEKAKKLAKQIMGGPKSPWKKGTDRKKEVDAARYYGNLNQSYDPRISEIFAHLSEENKELFLQVLGEEDGYERIAEAFGLTEEE